MADHFPLPYSGLHPKKVYRNLPAAALYELVRLRRGADILGGNLGRKAGSAGAPRGLAHAPPPLYLEEPGRLRRAWVPHLAAHPRDA
jgi:hypothetical protein